MEGGNKNERCQILVSCHQEAKVKSWKQVSKAWSSPIRSLLAACRAFYLKSLKTSTFVQQPQQNQFSSACKCTLPQLGHIGKQFPKGNALYVPRTCHFCRSVCILECQVWGTMLGLDPWKEDAFMTLVRDVCWNYGVTHHQIESVAPWLLKNQWPLTKR